MVAPMPKVLLRIGALALVLFAALLSTVALTVASADVRGCDRPVAQSSSASGCDSAGLPFRAH
jgi:hypothetical protein